MMHVVARTALGLCLGALLAGPVSAQERPLEELLASLNDQLRQHSYEDHDGQQTVSRVRLPGGGTIVVEITKRKAGNEVTNIFEASLQDLDVGRISARRRNGHTSLSLGVRGTVRVTLRCTTPAGATHEWDLPDTRELAVEFRSSSRLAADLSQGFAELIRRATDAPGMV